MTVNFEKLIQPQSSGVASWCKIEHWWLQASRHIDWGTTVKMARSIQNTLFLFAIALLSGLTLTIWLLPLSINSQPPPNVSAILFEEFLSPTIVQKRPVQDTIPEPEPGEIISTVAVTVTVTSLITGGILPDAYSLSQNYPNPFNSSTVIQYALPEAAWVRLEVFNMLGQAVATLVDGNQQAGVHSYNWNANNFASGIYFYRMTAGNFRDSKKMVIVK